MKPAPEQEQQRLTQIPNHNLACRVLLVFAVAVGMAWMVGSPLYATETCGNGLCDAGETKQSCPQDCRRLLKLLRERRGDGLRKRDGVSNNRPAKNISSSDPLSSLMVDGRERTYRLHLPSGYDPSKHYPLVVVLHGTMGSGEKVEQQTRFSDLADREQFLAVYPDALSNWSDGRGTSQAEIMKVDDVSFITVLICHLQGQYAIDSNRIYATGVSSGGIMTYWLGCEASGVFAALAPVIANIAEPVAGSCAPATSVALVTINGMEDPLVPFNGGECCRTKRGGGEGGRVVSHELSVGIFAKRNGCSPSPQKEILPAQVQDGTTVEKWTYLSCIKGGEIISYVIEGGGHAWPPNPPRAPRLAGASSRNLSATQVIWDFFKTHPKAEEVVP